MESLQAKRDEAMAAISQDGLASDNLRELFAIIRDPSGRVLCKARMRVWCEWSS